MPVLGLLGDPRGEDVRDALGHLRQSVVPPGTVGTPAPILSTMPSGVNWQTAGMQGGGGALGNERGSHRHGDRPAPRQRTGTPARRRSRSASRQTTRPRRTASTSFGIASRSEERQDLHAEAHPEGDEAGELRVAQPLGHRGDRQPRSAGPGPGEIPVAAVRQRDHDPARAYAWRSSASPVVLTSVHDPVGRPSRQGQTCS